jgi:hypothetical protein
MQRIIAVAAAYLSGLAGAAAFAGLEVSAIGQKYVRDEAKTPPQLYWSRDINPYGNTSARNEAEATLVWKGGDGDANGIGYFQRNRDLGQVFNIPAGQTLTIDAVILRTGNDTHAVMKGAPGAPVFMQFFEVEGKPTLNDNGTPFGTPATHGWDMKHSKADDYITGVTYTSLRVVDGGRFPQLAPTTRRGQSSHRVYLRWDLTGEDEVQLSGGESGRRYAFMVGFSQPGEAYGFALSNAWYMANEPAGSTLKFVTDVDGAPLWGIRREGDGTLPPTMASRERPAPQTDLYRKLVRESLFPEGAARFALPPTSDGYPDVCTYRVYEFYIEMR